MVPSSSYFTTASHELKIEFGLGVVFLVIGVAGVIMLPAPLWFDVIDLVFAYRPMVWIGTKLGGGCDQVVTHDVSADR